MCLVEFQIKGSIMKATSLIDFCSIACCRFMEFIFDEQVNYFHLVVQSTLE